MLFDPVYAKHLKVKSVQARLATDTHCSRIFLPMEAEYHLPVEDVLDRIETAIRSDGRRGVSAAIRIAHQQTSFREFRLWGFFFPFAASAILIGLCLLGYRTSGNRAALTAALPCALAAMAARVVISYPVIRSLPGRRAETNAIHYCLWELLQGKLPPDLDDREQAFMRQVVYSVRQGAKNAEPSG